jgi:twinkle protein
MRRKGLNFISALQLVANTVGIALPERRLHQPSEVKAAGSTQRGVFDPSEFRPLVPGGKVWNYLTEIRKLDSRKLVEYSVGETADGEAYSLAYKWFPLGGSRMEGSKSRFEFCKVIKVDRDANGKKIERRAPKGGKSILFGMAAVPENATELVITEGEVDAITWAQYGFAAVSVPNGTLYTGWLDTCWDWLQRFKKIHVSFDEDRAGRKKVVEIVQRLGMARTDIVRLPEKSAGGRFKDANECLQAGVSAQVMADCVVNAEVLRPAALKCILDFEREIWEKFHPDGREQMGLLLPWGNRHGSSLPFRFRYGEVTVWTGYSKHGKSELLNHVILDLCWQGDRALVCSLEVSAPETYRKLIQMALARRDVCAKEEREQFRERCLKPLAQKIWVYDHVGNAPIAEVLNVMLYSFQRYGCRQFVLDSLMKFDGLDGEGQDQWNAQRDFMCQILTFAATYGVHIHLVAHSKKPDRTGEAKIPRRYDISGSAYISNLAHNVIVVWRNRAKQDKLEEIFQTLEEEFARLHPTEGMPQWKRLLGGPPPKDAAPEIWAAWNRMLDFLEKETSKEARETFMSLAPLHDAYFIVDAQRGGDGDCPARHLWFHYDSLQFIEGSPWNTNLGANDPRKRPVEYVKKAALEMDEEF